jgi:predicted N-acyltransferase
MPNLSETSRSERSAPAADSTRPDVAAPGGDRGTRHICRVFRSTAEIDRTAWDGICAASGAPVFLDFRFAAAVEVGMRSQCRFWYVIVDDPIGRPVACAGFHAMTIDFTSFADPRFSGMIRRIPGLSRFRRVKALFCSLPGSPGDRAIAILPGADSAAVLRAIDNVMIALAREAGVEATVYKEFAPQEATWMDAVEELGYRRIEVPPMHLLPALVDDFTQYRAILKSHYRQNINRAMRKLKDTGIEMKVLVDPDEIARVYTPDVHAMYCEMANKSILKLEVFPIDYFLQLARHLAGQVELVAFFKEDRIVAFGWSLYDGNVYHMMYAGLNYAINRKFDLYFNLMYAMFDGALRRRTERIHVGQTATAFKSLVGCFSESRYIYVKGRGPVMWPFFRYGARLLVLKMPPNPPHDIFNRAQLERLGSRPGKAPPASVS